MPQTDLTDFDGGANKMSLRNFEEQAREQGGVFRRDATNQRAGTGDMDAEKEGKV
jgi:hypothetical protein